MDMHVLFVLTIIITKKGEIQTNENFKTSIPCYMLDSRCFVFIDYALLEFVLFLTCQQFRVTSVKCLDCIYFCKVGGVKH